MTVSKKTADDHYIRYGESIETIQPDEAKLIDKVVASMSRVGQSVCDKHRHASRNAHAKSHGILTGVLTVYDNLPPHLQQGMFREPGIYPIVVRFSSAPGDLHSDRVPAPKGMAIKVIGVEGRKVLAGHEDEVTQDFLLVNHPVIPFGDIASYWQVQQIAETHTDDSEAAQIAIAALAKGAAKVLNLAGVENHALENIGIAHHHILGETFHSMAALRFGDYVAKISVAPLSKAVRALTGQSYDPDHSPSVVRDQVTEFFKKQGAEYELRAQLCTDLESMPVEDASIVWPEDNSPHQAIARITFLQQDAYSPARRVFGDDVLSFNPWHCIPEHRPLGSIMRVRIKAYEASTAFRHAMNVQPRVEPRSIDEVPT